LRRVLRRRGPRRVTVSFWNTFYAPPYGGANQFMLALRAGLERQGVRVRDNHARGADVHVLQSIWFDVARFRRHFARRPMKVIHRIDGPIQLIRGRDREKDDEVFQLNADCAAATVVQSGWCLERLVELGYRPVKPVVIPNAADPDIFHARGRVEWSPRRKVRLISTAWSDNPRKGAALYQFLDEHLDWSRFEYTFVGRVAAPLRRIRVVPPVASAELASMLRAHDVYVTASEKDPCSNALIEALSCGLPALYRDDGGHPELVGQGGLPFRDEHDVLGQLDRLVEEYPSFQAVVAPPAMDEVAARYLDLIHAVRD
jgi:glycosyltransferase involved in cell wall biosynthesis